MALPVRLEIEQDPTESYVSQLIDAVAPCAATRTVAERWIFEHVPNLALPRTVREALDSLVEKKAYVRSFIAGEAHVGRPVQSAGPTAQKKGA